MGTQTVQPLQPLKRRWTAFRAVGLRFYHAHHQVLAFCALYAFTRCLMALFTTVTFAGYGPAVGQFLSQGQFSLSGAYPFIQYWAEYPPLFPWFVVVAYRLSLLLPPWTEPVLWFGTLLRWGMVPFEVGGVALVYALGRQLRTEATAWRSTVWYATAFVTLYVPLGWFDILPLFWLLLALYWILRDQPGWTGVATGWGLLAKPIAVLALPAAWQRWPTWRARLQLLATLGGVFLVGLAPFLIVSPQMTLAHFQNLFARPSWESVWALLDGYYSYGAVASLDQRFDPGTALWQIHANTSPYGLWATLGFVGLGGYLWTRRIDWRDNYRVVAFVGLTWCLFSLWSKGYSPQWLINFIPFVALLLPNLRGVVYLSLVSLALVGEWPMAFMLGSAKDWYFAAIIIWRTVLFGVLAIEFGLLALAQAPQHWWSRLAWAAVGGLGVSGLWLGAQFLQTYRQTRLESEPLRATIAALQQAALPGTGVVCREVEVCERLTPYLPTLDYFWFGEPNNWQATTLPAFARAHPVLWLVEEFHPETGHNLVVERYLSEHYSKESQIWVEGARLSRFITLEADGAAAPTSDVVFDCCLRLISYTLQVEARLVSLHLNWQTSASLAAYQPFIHIYSPAGELLTQNDLDPVGGFLPLEQWPLNTPILDAHGLILPAAPEPGTYAQIGWYNPQTGERLRIASSGNEAWRVVLIPPK